MIQNPGGDFVRSLRSVSLKSDLVATGGGMAGTFSAITAGRAGLPWQNAVVERLIGTFVMDNKKAIGDPRYVAEKPGRPIRL